MPPASRAYDRRARRYDRRWAAYTRRTLDLLDAYARIQPGERVLDVGCGTGVFLERLLRRDPARVAAGADLSERMLARARARLAAYPHVTLAGAEATALPFPDGAFDVVVTASALHYVRDVTGALAEAHRVLAPDGRLVALDWRRDTLPMQVLDRLLRLFDPPHARTRTPAELAAACRAAGLRVGAVARHRAGRWPLVVLIAHR